MSLLAAADKSFVSPSDLGVFHGPVLPSVNSVFPLSAIFLPSFETRLGLFSVLDFPTIQKLGF